jgi:STE24 endopeptidase
MPPFTLLSLAVVVLILLKGGVQLWLETLNRRHVLAHADAVPDAFKETVDAATYTKSVQYTLAKIGFTRIESIFDVVVLLAFLFSGLLPRAFQLATQTWGPSAWAGAAYLLVVGLAMSLPGMPLDWHEQFRLEARFGFNTITPKIWCMDRLKGLLLGVLIGYPLMVLVLKLVDWAGPSWWAWAWACVLVFELLMMVLAPVLIMPLFNKFTPLPEGSLRERLFQLARRTGFHARNIQVMDGSKRSRHSNAFFTGFGRSRKIVLFDTLIEQLTEPQLESVLAHEIGHFKKKHILKMLVGSAISLLAGFYIIAWLARQTWFFEAFGFQPGSIVPALLLFGLLSGLFTFWFSPLAHYWSRRHEYQADAYAAQVMREVDSLIGALRKLNEKNLSNLTPHPVYSGFYYSHPTLLERESALRKVKPAP